MMRAVILSLILCFLCLAGLAQNNPVAPAKPGCSGNIFDSLSKKPLQSVSVSLTNEINNQLTASTITDNNGHFTISAPAGKYLLAAGSVGYNSFIKPGIIIGTGNLVLPAIFLSKKNSLLKEVSVLSSKQVIENKIDKTVYNVDKDITSQGATTTDILKKIPQVSVDINGNVELLGNPSVRFLINGKPSGMFGNNPAEALQSIPASQLQSIEVITSPSAKYDAAGTAGIINIILKKNKMEGFNGNLSLSAGTRLENASVNAAVKKNNIGINSYFSGNMQLSSLTPISIDRISLNTGNGNSSFLQKSIVDFSRNGYKGGVSLDWSISKKDELSASIDFNHFANRNTGNYDQFFTQYNAAGTITSQSNSTRSSDLKLYSNSIDNEVSYKRKLAKENQELEVYYSGSYSGNNTFYNQLQHYPGADTAFAGSTSLNPGKENETDLGINYSHPLKKVLLETGLKASITSITSNATVLTLNTVTGSFITDKQQSFLSRFRRNVYAGYLSASLPVYKIFDVKAGIRFEHSVNDAFYSNSAKSPIPFYNNLAPNIIIQYKFSNSQSVKFSYSYRLERPDFRDLNPFMNLNDPHNITTGNPNLQPEIGHNYELGYLKTFKRSGSINLVLYMQKNSPDIKPYINYYPTYKIGDSTYTDVTITTRANIASEIKAGINLSISIPVTQQLTVRSNIQLFNRHLQNNLDSPSVMNAFAARTNMNLAYQFKHSIAAEIFGNYNSGMKWQGKRPAAFSYTMAMRKQFKNNKGSIGFIAVNPFNKYINQRTLQQAKGFTTNLFQQLPYRSFGLSFSYKFGGLKFSKPKEGDSYFYTPPVEN